MDNSNNSIESIHHMMYTNSVLCTNLIDGGPPMRWTGAMQHSIIVFDCSK